MEMERAPILECSVRIENFEHHTCQGRVWFRGKEQSFCSELELIQIIDGLLEARPGRIEEEETT